MRVIKRKLFTVWQFEKEIEWLNEMSAQGLQLIDSSGWRYAFDVGTQGEYLYDIVYLKEPSYALTTRNFIEFMEESGAEQVGQCWNRFYFRKKASEGAFNIYSDADSRIKLYRRIMWPILFTGILCLIFGTINSLLFLGEPIDVFISSSYFITLAVASYSSWRIERKVRKLKRMQIINES